MMIQIKQNSRYINGIHKALSRVKLVMSMISVFQITLSMLFIPMEISISYKRSKLLKMYLYLWVQLI